MAAHTGAPQPALGSRVARLAAKHAAINPPKSAENIEIPYLWLRNDGGTEPDRGHSVSFSWSAYPSRGEGSAGHFSEACPANGLNPRATLRYSSIQASFIELAEPSYYINWSRISSTLPASRLSPKVHGISPVNLPQAAFRRTGAKPAAIRFSLIFQPAGAEREGEVRRERCPARNCPKEPKTGSLGAPSSTRAKQLSCGALEKRAVMLKKSPQESTLNSLLILCALKHLSRCRE